MTESVLNMSRFQREISGKLGKYWQESAERELKSLLELVNKDASVDNDGAIFWKNTNTYLGDDLCERLEYTKYNFCRSATANKREEQIVSNINRALKELKNK